MHPVIQIGPAAVSAYTVCMAAGIIAAFTVSFLRLRKKGVSVDALLLVSAVAVAIGLCGARISYYVFSYGLGRLLREMFNGDFSGFRSAGLVYYGGLAGGIAGAFIAIRTQHASFDTYANAIVPCIPLGHAFGRIGCWMAGCCYGIPWEGPLAVHSLQAGADAGLFPVQAAGALLNLGLFFALIRFTRKERKGIVTLALYLVLYAALRFILEFFRGDLIRGVYAGLSTSQWISLLLILASLVLFRMVRKGYLKLS